jgi:anti-sigma regulatory factor (Ser/Thr protein kinase)
MDSIKLHYDVPGDDFTRAGAASSDVKRNLKQLGISPSVIRNVSIAMYEAEINTIIHGGGGECEAEVLPGKISVTFKDQGPGIANLDLAMQEGYSTAGDKIRELGFGAGMGLPNIKKYTDDMLIDTAPGKGTTITLIVNL